MAGVKVIGALPSPFSHRVQWALKMKGIDYEYVEEDLFNKSPLLLQYNPLHKKVPVLLHNGRPIVESIVILEYIDEEWKHNPILPEVPYERAAARFWAKFSDEKCLPAILGAFCSQGEVQEKYMVSAREGLKTLDKELSGKKFFGGETFGFVDLVVGWMGHWFNVLEEIAGIELDDPNKFPSLHAWMKNFLNIAVIKENLPPRDRMVTFFRRLREVELGSNGK